MVKTKRIASELNGRHTHPENKRIRRIRARSSYVLFSRLYDFLKSSPDIATVLRKVYSILDAKRGFGSQRNAEYAAESLDWVLMDVGEDAHRLPTDSEAF